MNKDQILNAILTESQRLAIHFLELLPEGKQPPDYRNEYHMEWSKNFGDLGSGIFCELNFRGGNIYMRRNFIDEKEYKLLKTAGANGMFYLTSTTIPQEILDLIPDREK